MAYCPPELLDDVADVLAEIRAWDGVVEKKRHVFYLRRQPFLHFHLLSDGRRRADLRARDGWVQVDIARPLSAARRRILLRALRAVHGERAVRASAVPGKPTPPATGGDRGRPRR